jgi:adenylate cyclase
VGDRQLKNIARPIRVYAINLTAPRPPSSSATSTRRLSIVVLPFANLSNDPEQEYFVDGITEDLTTELSRIPEMVVISRNTAFTYRRRTVDTRQIGRELGVSYLLEGSVRRSGNQIRVNAQLIDAPTDTHLWAERFDGAAEDLFALQDEITTRIAKALAVELAVAEAARPVEHLDALDCILRGRAVAAKPRSAAGQDEAIGWYERALAFNPASAEAQAYLARALVSRVQDFVPESSDADIDRAEGLARQALMSSQRSALTHTSMAEVLRTQRRYAEAIYEYEAALALDRNSVTALANLGRCKTYIGLVDDAISAQENAIRLSPRDPIASIGIFVSAKLIYFSRAWITQSTGSKRHAAAPPPYGMCMLGWRPPMPRRETWNTLVPNFAQQRVFGEPTSSEGLLRAQFEKTILAGLHCATMPNST